LSVQFAVRQFEANPEFEKDRRIPVSGRTRAKVENARNAYCIPLPVCHRVAILLSVIQFLRMRPRLRLQSSLSPDQAVERLREALDVGNPEVTATFSGRYVVLRINEERQHFGSPQLSFEVEAADGGSALTGLFMPMPSVWTAFMALYGLIVFGGFCGAVYGYAQVQVDKTPHALWAVPLALVLLTMVYVAACVGQRMGSEQMQELRQFVEDSLGRSE